MFACISFGVLNFAFPDVCLTPIVVPVPIPYPNIALSPTHIPSQFNVIFGGGLAENLLTQGTISNGDQPGVLLGVASGTIMGPDRYILGSFKVIIGVAFASRLTSITMQNTTNMIGFSIVPGQFRVLILS
ncbi:MAG: DUF4150 domain-containing protein [Betaproteobacteria bacterium]|nr:DUF4150 domain-containing protein [Betaproteobacteria bacterium]